MCFPSSLSSVLPRSGRNDLPGSRGLRLEPAPPGGGDNVEHDADYEQQTADPGESEADQANGNPGHLRPEEAGRVEHLRLVDGETVHLPGEPHDGPCVGPEPDNEQGEADPDE